MWLHIVFVLLFFVVHSQTSSCFVEETKLGGSIVQIVTVNDTIAFLLTSANTVFRTADGGVTWQDQSSELFTGVVIIAQSSNPFLLYFGGIVGDIWITLDGTNYEHSNPITYDTNYNSSVVNILPHPTNTSYVALVIQICVPSDPCFQSLVFGNNSIMSLFLTDQYIFMDSVTWGPAGSPGHLDTEFYGLSLTFNDNNTEIAAFFSTTDLNTFSNPLGDFPFGSLSYDSELDAFLLLSYFLPLETYLVPSSFFITKAQKETYSLTKWGSAIENIAVLDSTSGSIFLGVQNSQQPNNSVELFVSNPLNSQFQLSLEDVFALPTGIDFLSLAEEIFLANRLINPSSMQTVVSSNKGENWATLTAPANEVQNCTKNCTLQLFGSDDFTGGIYAKINQYTLVVIGLGMVGPQLVHNPSLANLYISRDGGKTWRRLYNGSWRFDSSATTGFIAITEFQTPTNKLLYTYDEGQTWSTCSFQPSSDTRTLYVDRVSTSLVAPLKSTGVWVATHWSSGGNTEYSIFHVQFNVSIRPCNASDYEVFSLEEECVLGQQTWIKRKKASSVCQVDPSINMTFLTPCNCTRADFTCAFCFVVANGVCLLSFPPNDSAVCAPLQNPPAVCPPGSNYSAPIAYARVQGTKCINGQSFLTPDQIPCPSFPEPQVPQPKPPTSIPVPISGPVPTSFPVSPGPSPSPLSFQNNSDINNDNSAKSSEAGYIALGVILGVLFVVVVIVIIVVVVKFCVSPSSGDDKMELS